MASAARVLAELISNGQDFEWYPTTDKAYSLENDGNVVQLLTARAA